MLTRSAYLEWLTYYYPKVVHNLAASGVPSLTSDELAEIPLRWSANPVSALTEKLAQLYCLQNTEILPCNGASQALWLAYAATLFPGDDVLIETPTYAPFADSVRTLGANLIRFERLAVNGYVLDPDSVFQKLTKRTRLVALSSLHNPSGCSADPKAIAGIAAELAKRNGYLIVNEIYAFFDDLDVCNAMTLRSSRHIAPNIICVSSLSKAFGLGPMRIGWLSGPEHVVRRAAMAQLASTGDLPMVWAAGAIGALELLPDLATRAKLLTGDKRERVFDWLAARPWLSWSRPANGLFGLITLPGKINTLELAEKAIKEHGVMIAPGEFFAAPGSFRLAWNCPTARLDSALAALDVALNESLRV